MRSMAQISAMGIKSFALDKDFLAINMLSNLKKLKFITQKYIALLKISFGKTSAININAAYFRPQDVSTLGTLQSNITDFYHDIVLSNIIKRSDPLILDIGANLGQFCSAVNLFFPDSKVHCFEPALDVFEGLSANTKGFKNVKLYKQGLGDKNEVRKFYIHSLSLMSSFKKYPAHEYTEENIQQLEIKKLDSLLTDERRIDLMKVDVEGFELNTLKGAVNTLQRVNFLIIEVSLGRENSANSNLDVLGFIKNTCPKARIIKFGRPLGEVANPLCQDVLIELNTSH